MSDWLDPDRPTDAPRVKEESKKVRVWNAIGSIILTPLLFAVWIWAGFQAVSQEPASQISDIAATAPYTSVILFGAIALLPVAIVALLLANRGK
jgi:hypothetical protein